MYFQYAAMIMIVEAVINAIATLLFGSMTVTTESNRKTTSHAGGNVLNILLSAALSAYFIYVVLSKKYHLEQQLSAGGY